MSKQKVVVFDCDEILLDHLGGFRGWLAKKHGIICKSDYPDKYDLSEWMGVEDANEVRTYLREFNQESYEFGLLKPLYDYIPNYVSALRHTLPDAKFAVLTKSGTMGHGEVLRRVNIENVFPGVFDEIHIVEMYESKRGALHKLQVKYDVVCLVDDYIENIETAIELGIHGIMLECHHNKQYKDREDFYYTNSWGGVMHNVILHHNKGG